MSRLFKHWFWFMVALETFGFGAIMLFREVSLDQHTPEPFIVIASDNIDIAFIVLSLSVFLSYLLSNDQHVWIDYWRLVNIGLLSGAWLMIAVSFTVSDTVPPLGITLNTLFSWVICLNIIYHAWIEPIRRHRKRLI